MPRCALQICNKPANRCRGRRPRRPVGGRKIHRTHVSRHKHCKLFVGADACHRPADGRKNDWASALCHAVGRPALWPPDDGRCLIRLCFLGSARGTTPHRLSPERPEGWFLTQGLKISRTTAIYTHKIYLPITHHRGRAKPGPPPVYDGLSLYTLLVNCNIVLPCGGRIRRGSSFSGSAARQHRPQPAARQCR